MAKNSDRKQHINVSGIWRGNSIAYQAWRMKAYGSIAYGMASTASAWRHAVSSGAPYHRNGVMAASALGIINGMAISVSVAKIMT